MLKSLNIRNYAIVENLTIDFDKGFNVFTGETGAGKSIIVGALTFLLRGRSDSSIIMKDKEKAIIEGEFEINDPIILEKLKEQDIDVEDNQIIVKRVISYDNRNSIKINQSSVTLSFLEDLFSSYVDIHSQKDSHFLYDKKNQLYLLDKYANNTDAYKEYRNAYDAYKKEYGEYKRLCESDFNEQEYEFSKFDLNELEEANLSFDEEKDLEEKERRYKSLEKNLIAINNCLDLFSGDNGISEKLQEVNSLLSSDDEEIEVISSNIKDLYYSLDDEFSKLRDFMSNLIESNIDIEYIESRLFTYSKLKRKHKTDVEGLINLKNELEAKIKSYEDKDVFLAEKAKSLAILKEQTEKAAFKLHATRLKAAELLEKEISKEAQDLLLNNFVFKIEIKGIELSTSGSDEIEFLVSMNKGEDVKPLKNVASGGEVSRLMLALKVVFLKLSNTGLLILDEIDTGVSGKVALAVGEKIAKISRFAQIICISHLAPVAACASSQFLIYKEDNETNTTTKVKLLDTEERIKQLAIISNTCTDTSALHAAKELLEHCQILVN